MLVLAGAGSGKTRVLTVRIAHLIDEFGVDPASILALTFTNKAAGEMRERVRTLLGREPGGMWIGTFHSVGARILRRHATRLGWSPSFTIYDADDSSADQAHPPRRAEARPEAVEPAGGARRDLQRQERAAGPRRTRRRPSTRSRSVVAEVYERYQAGAEGRQRLRLRRPAGEAGGAPAHPPAGAPGYRERFQFLLVDEYQDTNRAQYVPSCGCWPRSTATSSWWATTTSRSTAGAAPTSATSSTSKRTSPAPGPCGWSRTTAPLAPSWTRPTASSRRTSTARGRRCAPTRGGGAHHPGGGADEADEAAWIADEIVAPAPRRRGGALRDFVVLYRTNAQSRALEEALRTRGLPTGSWAAPASTSGARSATCSPTCGWWRTRPPTRPSCASPTCRAAASATPPWPGWWSGRGSGR
jgi:DNA helicase II / ATP-dependent DNA helicase PcrA